MISKINKFVPINIQINFYFTTIICLLIFFLYFPLFDGHFLLDDSTSIVKNPHIRGVDLKQIYSFSPLRFFSYLSLALNFHFSKLDPFSYHMVNICIHISYVIAYYFFLLTLWQTPVGIKTEISDTEKRYISMASALIIAVHPMSAFSVSYIIQRTASLMAFFYISGLFFYLKARITDILSKRILFNICFILLISCALFTKQNSFTIFPVLLLIELFCFDLTKKKVIFSLSIALCCALAFTLLITTNIINSDSLRQITYETKSIGRLEYFTNQFPVLWFYLSQIFFPIKLATDYQHVIHSNFLHPDIVIPGIGLLGLIIFSIVTFFKKNLKFVGWGILFYFIAISIESGLIPIQDSIFIHRTYLPNAGIIFSIILMAYIGLKKIISLRAIFIFFIASSLLLAMATIRTNLIFQDPVKVWQRVINISPSHARAYLQLGSIHISRGDYDIAEKNTLKALELKPRSLIGLNNMGIIYYRKEQYDKAIKTFNLIIKIKKNLPNAYANLGNTYSLMNNYDKAIEYYRKALKHNKNDFKTLLNLGQLITHTSGHKNQLNKALILLQKAEAINDKNPQLFYSKGYTLFKLKKYNSAIANLNRSLYLNPKLKKADELLKTINKIQNTP